MHILKWPSRTWISGRDSGVLAKNLVILPKRITRRDAPVVKDFRFTGNFCFDETKVPVSEIFADFHETLDNFLVSVVTFYCRSEVIFSHDFTEFSWYKNSEFSRGILRILPVFGKIFVYLRKVIVDFFKKEINCGKMLIFR